MKCTTSWNKWSREWWSLAHTAAAIGLIVMAVMGGAEESLGGWVTNSPRVIIAEGVKGWSKRERQWERCEWGAGWRYLKRSGWIALARSEALLLMVVVSHQDKWAWVSVLPWGVWVWRGMGVSCPWLWGVRGYREVGRIGEDLSRGALIGLSVWWVVEQISGSERQVLLTGVVGDELGGGCWMPGLAIGGVVSPVEIEVEQDEAGWYQVQFKQAEQVLFELCLDGQVEFYKRLLIIFLGLLEVPGEVRASRRTRDGRRPMVRQQELERWFGERQPVISRWRGYWLKQDWRRLLSMYAPEVLSLEVQQRIIETWAKFPWWGPEHLLAYLREQGEAVTGSQVRQAGHESGWTVLRAELEQVYLISAESFRPRDGWLVSQLLLQIQRLVSQLEAVGGLPAEQRLELHDLEALSGELGLTPQPARAPLPWVLHLEHVLLGHWELVEDGSVKCIYCGSPDVSRKSRTPRLKSYVDSAGEMHTLEVCRFYCHNPACPYHSFTNLPPNLLPNSARGVEWRVAALQTYSWMHSVYRCSAQTLGVSKMTAYRWVSDWGYALLPIAAVFGVLRSSGVVGVDEKYVLVPKNDKPDRKMKRWMYVYVAVDCYTYDLLHIEIYPYNTSDSATAFLLALRAKGYQPRVLVTDLRQDYGPIITHVFPNALHHECIFHALQQVHKDLKQAYGKDYAHTHPHVEQLRLEIDSIFQAKTKRTARHRYEAVLAQREHFIPAAPVFDLLERHWPKLINAIESNLIPTTNNATEQVIRIFTQHYKTFCGFESLDSARLYLAVFEKVYRFSPFSDDAQAHLRGKCPLQVAGYDVKSLPMADLFRGFALQWPPQAFKEFVPWV